MRALVIGGTGLLGRAVARRLVVAGWQVDVVGRDVHRLPPDLREQGVRFLAADRNIPIEIGRAFGVGADLLLDCVCYSAAQARALLPLAAEAGSTAMISTKAVYVDDDGRHSNSAEPPHFGGAVRETQATVTPGDLPFDTAEGYGRNKVAAENTLLDSGYPISVLRPSKIHGEGARPAREWFFVKRILDRRSAVLLAHGGRGIDHPSAAVNIAALVEAVACTPGCRILNAADPDAPNGLEIARIIAGHLGHYWEEVLLDDDTDESLGRHPWDRPHPIVLDTTAATELGYRPVGSYATTVRAEVDWLVRSACRAGVNELPRGYESEFFGGRFDYDAEDGFLAEGSPAVGQP